MSFKNVPRQVSGPVGTVIEFLPEVSSTNDYLHKHSASVNGHLVVADHQTMGRGRAGHRWIDDTDKSLLFSFRLSFAAVEATVRLLPVLTSLGLCEALNAVAAPGFQTKWPNDIVRNDRKLCGILIESSVQGEMAEVVVGIGLNVNQLEFSEELRETATSIALEVGRRFDREKVLGAVIDSLNATIYSMDRGEVIRAYSKLCSTLGRRISFEVNGTRHYGTAIEVDDIGALVIDEAGKRHVYVGSEITHLRPVR